MAGQHLGPVESQGVALDHRHAVALDDLAQRRQQVAVDLDGHDLRAGLGERHREGTQAGPDLDDRVTRADAGEPHDLAHRVGVDEEVLAQRPTRAQAVPLEQVDGLAAGEGHRVTSLPNDPRPAIRAAIGSAGEEVSRRPHPRA